MSEVEACFKITPVPAPRMVQSDKWGTKRPPVLRYFAYRDQLQLIAALHGYTVDPVLSMKFIMPMPESWSKSKKFTMDGQAHQQKPDLDNLVKAFKDSLCEDDSFVHTYRDISKVWGQEGAIVVKTQLQPGGWQQHPELVLPVSAD